MVYLFYDDLPWALLWWFFLFLSWVNILALKILKRKDGVPVGLIGEFEKQGDDDVEGSTSCKGTCPCPVWWRGPITYSKWMYPSISLTNPHRQLVQPVTLTPILLFPPLCLIASLTCYFSFRNLFSFYGGKKTHFLHCFLKHFFFAKYIRVIK